MSSAAVTQTQHPLFPTLDDKATVQVHALSAGHLTLPEKHFVHPASDTARHTVPSLSFLIQHVDFDSGKRTRILFDLGLRRDLSRYSEPIQRHAATRQPISTDPDVVKSLAAGGLTPDDIDYVIFSHLHWDHIGTPSDFPHSTFIVGPGSLALLSSTPRPSLPGSHSHFEPALLPAARTIELSAPSAAAPSAPPGAPPPFRHLPWRPCPAGLLPHTLDLFADSSLLLVLAPGHLPGHLNLLARTGPGHLLYLAADACHDARILRGERAVAEWRDDAGRLCCIHADRAAAEETVARVRRLRDELGVEVVCAHDGEWERRNGARFWGAERAEEEERA